MATAVAGKRRDGVRRADAALRDEARYRTVRELAGFALHEVVLDEDGEPVDYVFLCAWRPVSSLNPLRVSGPQPLASLPPMTDTDLPV